MCPNVAVEYAHQHDLRIPQSVLELWERIYERTVPPIEWATITDFLPYRCLAFLYQHWVHKEASPLTFDFQCRI